MCDSVFSYLTGGCREDSNCILLLTCCSQGWAGPTLLYSPHTPCKANPSHPGGSLLYLIHCFESGHSTSNVVLQVWIEKNNCFSQPAACSPASTAHYTWPWLWAHWWLAPGLAISTWSLSSATQLYSQLLLSLCHSCFSHSRHRLLLNFMMFLSICFSSLLLSSLSATLHKGSFEFGEFSEVECTPPSQLIMENLIYCSPQNDKLYVAGWYCCMFFGSSLPLAGLVWLLNFKEGKEGMLSSTQGILCPLQAIPLCWGSCMWHAEVS